MKQGNIALSALPQADGKIKLRPVLLLKQLPGHGDWLVCGISSQLHQFIPGFDMLIEVSHTDYKKSGLKNAVLSAWVFLSVIPNVAIAGTLGEISEGALNTLLKTLSEYLLN